MALRGTHILSRWVAIRTRHGIEILNKRLTPAVLSNAEMQGASQDQIRLVASEVMALNDLYFLKHSVAATEAEASGSAILCVPCCSR